eukprot:GFYU01001017.1.p1 GENE.GFYU01001017.1~~GFYU01001017.1.p1  ORF type:complete len:547 (+),score=96.18 GFYU01001017.1:89-1729(+)
MTGQSVKQPTDCDFYSDLLSGCLDSDSLFPQLAMDKPDKQLSTAELEKLSGALSRVPVNAEGWATAGSGLAAGASSLSEWMWILDDKKSESSCLQGIKLDDQPTTDCCKDMQKVSTAVKNTHDVSTVTGAAPAPAAGAACAAAPVADPVVLSVPTTTITPSALHAPPVTASIPVSAPTPTPVHTLAPTPPVTAAVKTEVPAAASVTPPPQQVLQNMQMPLTMYNTPNNMQTLQMPQQGAGYMPLPMQLNMNMVQMPMHQLAHAQQVAATQYQGQSNQLSYAVPVAVPVPVMMRRQNSATASPTSLYPPTGVPTTGDTLLKKRPRESASGASSPAPIVPTPAAAAKGTTATASSSAADEEDDEAKKRQRRLLRNRMSAELSRQRRKAYVDELEGQLSEAHAKSFGLEKEVEKLKSELVVSQTETEDVKKELKALSDMFTKHFGYVPQLRVAATPDTAGTPNTTTNDVSTTATATTGNTASPMDATPVQAPGVEESKVTATNVFPTVTPTAVSVLPQVTPVSVALVDVPTPPNQECSSSNHASHTTSQ